MNFNNINGFSVIYKITNPTGRIYVGKTTNIKKRYYSYSKNNVESQKAIYNSIKKHGWDNHIFEILFVSNTCSAERLTELEINYIKNNNSLHPKGLNCILTKDFPRTCNSNFIYCYDLEGNFIKKFSSVKEASKILNIPSYSISKVKNKTNKYALKYRFSEYYLPKIDPIKQIIKSTCKRLYKYDSNGNFIDSYFSISKAHKSVGCNGLTHSSLGVAVDKYKLSYNYFWFSEFKGSKIEVPKLKLQYSYILKELNTNNILEFKSLRKTREFLNVHYSAISDCIENKKPIKNYLITKIL